MKQEKHIYVSPQVEIVEILVEQGFAQSETKTPNTPYWDEGFDI